MKTTDHRRAIVAKFSGRIVSAEDGIARATDRAKQTDLLLNENFRASNGPESRRNITPQPTINLARPMRV
jgi:hypothetical protein